MSAVPWPRTARQHDLGSERVPRYDNAVTFWRVVEIMRMFLPTVCRDSVKVRVPPRLGTVWAPNGCVCVKLPQDSESLVCCGWRPHCGKGGLLSRGDPEAEREPGEAQAWRQVLTPETGSE